MSVVSHENKSRSPSRWKSGIAPCCILLTITAMAPAQIINWQTGQVIPGTELIKPEPGVDLSGWNSNAHNLKSADFPGGLDLRGSNFSESWLNAARFHSANLSSTYFGSSRLTNADLSAANLNHAFMDDVNLSNADLSNADLTNASINYGTKTNANFTGAIIAGASIGGFTKEQLYSTASYQQKNLQGVAFGPNVSGWDFSGQDLSNAYLVDANLTGTNLAQAEVVGTSFLDPIGFTKEQLYSTASYQRTDLRGTVFGSQNGTSIDLSGWNFNGQNLAKGSFLYADLTGVDFTDAIVYGAYFLNDSLSKEQLYSTASYQQKNLQGIQLSDGNVSGWNFNGQDLSNAGISSNMDNANLSDAVITGASIALNSTRFTKEQLYSTASYQQKNLRGVSLAFGNLTDWDFSGQDLTDANLETSTVRRADFTGAVVNGVHMGSALTKEQLFSTASYQQKNLQGIWFYEETGRIAGWDFSGQDLTDAVFLQTALRNADFSGAVINGTSFWHTGLSKEQLYSTASYQNKNLQGLHLRADILSGWDFSGQDLTGIDLWGSNPTGIDFANSVITNASFDYSDGLTKDQVYSTISYQSKNLQGVGFAGVDLSGWDLSGQNLTNGLLEDPETADLSFADLRNNLEYAGVRPRNAILPNGSIEGLQLNANDVLLVRDHDGYAGGIWSLNNPSGPIAITVRNQMTMADGATLQLAFEEDPWDSTISFQQGIPLSLGGTLDLTFAAEVNPASQVGRSFDIFDWTGVSPNGAFDVSSRYALYGYLFGDRRNNPMATGTMQNELPTQSNAMDPPAEANGLREIRHQFTPNLTSLLAELKASLLISTYQAGKVVVVGVDQGQLSLAYHNFEQAMGLAIGPQGLAVGARAQIWFLQRRPDLAPQIEPLGRHDACLVTRSSHYTGEMLGHEMAYSGSDLWIVNTAFSCLCTLHPQFSFEPRWRPRFISRLAAEDRCHLNGLAMSEGKPRYVTVLSETDTARGWRADKSSSGCLIDVASNQTVAHGFAMPHSPRVHGGRVWLLNSGWGRLLLVDPATGKHDVVTELPGYTRGLAFCDRFAFVGLSKIREASTFGGMPIAERREELKCGVGAIDLGTGRLAAHLEFVTGVEEIFDVRVLPNACFPVLSGPFPTLDGTSPIWTVPTSAPKANGSHGDGS